MRKITMAGLKLFGGLVFSLTLAAAALAQQAVAPATAPARPPANPHAEVPLWPNGAPGSEGKTAPEVVTTDADGERSVTTVNNPSTRALPGARAARTGATPVAAIIIAPGGGHYKLTMDDEGYDVAKYLSGHGVAAFVLKYRLAHEPGSTYTVDGDEMHDVQHAIRMVKARAAEWGVDPARVGVMGFSAGGELAIKAAHTTTMAIPPQPTPSTAPATSPPFRF